MVHHFLTIAIRWYIIWQIRKEQVHIFPCAVPVRCDAACAHFLRHLDCRVGAQGTQFARFPGTNEQTLTQTCVFAKDYKYRGGMFAEDYWYKSGTAFSY
jgi:hypothetical protein